MLPVGNYLLKFNGNTRTMCEICSKLTLRTSDDVNNTYFDNSIDEEDQAALIPGYDNSQADHSCSFKGESFYIY